MVREWLFAVIDLLERDVCVESGLPLRTVEEEDNGWGTSPLGIAVDFQ